MPPADRPYGAFLPGGFDSAVIAATSRMPDNWPGLRLAILLRRAVTMRLPSDGGLDVERWGLRMRLHPRDNGCEKNLLFTPQMYEAPERAELTREMERVRREGRPFVFVDVGANVGLFSLFVAAHAKPARIVAIEPEPGNLARLRFNVAANPGLPIDVAPLAVGEAEQEVAIEFNAGDRGGAHTRKLDASDQDAVRVRCLPLLTLLRERGIERIDALKIDVEGAEYRVLAPFFRDAPRALWPRLMLIEDTRQLWEDDLFGQLAALGYRTDRRSKLNAMLRLREDAA